jgi:hypothetical protein
MGGDVAFVDLSRVSNASESWHTIESESCDSSAPNQNLASEPTKIISVTQSCAGPLESDSYFLQVSESFVSFF